LRKLRARELSENAVRVRDARDDVRGDVDHASAVDAIDSDGRLRLLDHRRLVQRDLSAIGRADEEVLERVHRATIGLRKLYHHPELVAPSRLAKRLGSVERVTDLRAKIARRDAKAPPFRGDLEVELGHGPTEALADILDARVEGERVGEVRCSVPQRLDVRVSKLDVDLGRAARADEVV